MSHYAGTCIKCGESDALDVDTGKCCECGWSEYQEAESLRSELDAARLRIASLEAAIRQCSVLFEDIRGDFRDPRGMCDEAQSVVGAALLGVPSALTDIIEKAVEMARCADVDGWDYTEEQIADRILGGGK